MVGKLTCAALVVLLCTSPASTQQPNVRFRDRLPARVIDHWFSAPKLVGSPNLIWRKEIITVAFSGASEPVYELIERAASDWTIHGGGTKFSFRDAQGRFRRWSASDKFPAAAIRIGFSEASEDGGYWSAIGTMATAVPAGEQTMNFGGFASSLRNFYGRPTSAAWLASYERSTILHEFGHALGLSHEHFHPKCQADLRIDAAVRYLMGPPNGWSEEQARFNIDADYYFRVSSSGDPSDQTTPVSRFDISERIDRASIMLYDFPDPTYYRSGTKSPCLPATAPGFATSLSRDDIATFVRYYPARRR